MTEVTSDYIYKTTAKKVYGMTDKMLIALGKPDKLVPNPHRKTQKAALYLRQRVTEWIDANQGWWKQEVDKRAERSARSRQAADNKRQKTIAWAETIVIITDPLPVSFAKLAQETTDRGNERLYEQGRFYDQYILSSSAVVAHLRHMYTNYESLLQELEGLVGTAEAYMIIRQRCDALITERLTLQYPTWERLI